ncbi:uncharacterized protein LOC143821096 isoform X2 [Paroedura picta]|uniref:uncharacterized protein LOC143821096 isoform X2 n=1 Tax=Paroedura picta TaxID=143630 RepID=UPI0040569F94
MWQHSMWRDVMLTLYLPQLHGQHLHQSPSGTCNTGCKLQISGTAGAKDSVTHTNCNTSFLNWLRDYTFYGRWTSLHGTPSMSRKKDSAQKQYIEQSSQGYPTSDYRLERLSDSGLEKIDIVKRLLHREAQVFFEFDTLHPSRLKSTLDLSSVNH